jgi:hypothetical protein
MSIPAKLTAATTAIVLGLASAALASGPGTHGRSQSAPGHNRAQQTSSTGTTTGTTSTPSPNNNGKAYGRLCQGESKKHVAGQKGTPFSNCVTDMAHLAKSSQSNTTSQPNPARACANESKKHVAGQKGTPFSQCVSAAAKLLGNENGGPTTTTSDGS